MSGENDDISLVEEYRLLKRLSAQEGVEERVAAENDRKLDAIYKHIVSRPIVGIPDALETLWFAHQCLTDEGDIKEAASLIHQVCCALSAFRHKASKGATVA
jgi:hypothetical protein